VQVERHADADSFLARAGGFLLEREAEHNLILGLCARLRHDPQMYGHDPYFAVAVKGGGIVAVALRTPPHNLILSQVDDERALEPLASDVHSVFDALPGVVGPTKAVGVFARTWEERVGAPARLALRQRIYRAEEARPPAGVAGQMRTYAEGDRKLLLEWLDAFVAEALPAAPPEDSEGVLEHRLTDPAGGFVLWEDDRPVSFGGFGGPTPNGIRIGPVYTPPELRRRGYASALTAELTRTLLEGGRRFCFLFTDLANPTSNTIYQRVGYEPVTDVDQWGFG
jgi:predicted GNAT family acetyltransferase